jgi:hypothetical protein
MRAARDGQGRRHNMEHDQSKGPLGFDLLVPEKSESKEKAVRWSDDYQNAYYVEPGDGTYHVTVFADKLSTKQRDEFIRNRWLHMSELEKLGAPLTFSEFHVTIDKTGLHHYYRVNGRRIYKTAKFTAERTATAHDVWDVADGCASAFLMGIGEQWTVYEPGGRPVYPKTGT